MELQVKDKISKIRKYDKDLSLITALLPLERKLILGEDYNYLSENYSDTWISRF